MEPCRTGKNLRNFLPIFASSIAVVTVLLLIPAAPVSGSQDSALPSESKSNPCRKIISKDKSFILVENCDRADIDLKTDGGSRIRIKSKGRSNSIIVHTD